MRIFHCMEGSLMAGVLLFHLATYPQSLVHGRDTAGHVKCVWQPRGGPHDSAPTCSIWEDTSPGFESWGRGLGSAGTNHEEA